MGKKKQKKVNSFSDSLNISSKNSSFGDQSSLQDSIKEESSKVYKIRLCQNTEDKETYYKWTKNCSWKNIAFIHPSIANDLHIGAFVFIEDEHNKAICIVYLLKSVKKSQVVLLSNLGFKEDELVTISAYEGKGYEAEDIFILQPQLEINTFIKDTLQRQLSHVFLWSGLTINLVYIDTKYEFTITDIKSSGNVSHQNFSASLSNEVSNCNITSESNLSSMMSSMNLQDYEDVSFVSSKEHNHQSIPNFFTISYKTSLHFSSSAEELKICKPLFQHIGGYKKQIELIQKFIDNFLIKASQEVNRCYLLLLSGPQGTGKTLILKAIKNEYSSCCEEISRIDLLNKESFDAIREIKKQFEEKEPSILLFDEFDQFYPPVKGSQYFHLEETLQIHIATCNSPILLIGTVSNKSNFKEDFPLFYVTEEIKFSSPSTQEREEIIEKILLDLKHELSSSEIKKCADCSEGMTSVEIFKAIKYTGVLLAHIRIKNSAKGNEIMLSFSDLKKAIQMKKSRLMSSNLKTKKVLWSDIGGMNFIKEKLIEEMKLFQLSPEMKKRFNYTPSRGILLYGPPGCSKTMIAKALATECNWNFISKKSSELLNMYVGESEKSISKLFLEAKARSPCIIFIDEIDALAPDRSSCASSSGVANRIVSTLLTEMDGFETLNDVMVLAATNRPDIIDPALMRPGRIGQHIYVPLPDSETRKEILKLSLQRRNLHQDVNVDYLVEKTEGYTGAEIVHLCNEAAIQILMENPDCESPAFRLKHFEKALIIVPPRTSKDLLKCYEQLIQFK